VSGLDARFALCSKIWQDKKFHVAGENRNCSSLQERKTVCAATITEVAACYLTVKKHDEK